MNSGPTIESLIGEHFEERLSDGLNYLQMEFYHWDAAERIETLVDKVGFPLPEAYALALLEQGLDVNDIALISDSSVQSVSSTVVSAKMLKDEYMNASMYVNGESVSHVYSDTFGTISDDEYSVSLYVVRYTPPLYEKNVSGGRNTIRYEYSVRMRLIHIFSNVPRTVTTQIDFEGANNVRDWFGEDAKRAVYGLFKDGDNSGELDEWISNIETDVDEELPRRMGSVSLG